MLNAFLLSFRLRIAYRVNSILYWIKHLPLLRKILPGDIYGAGWLKIVATIFAGQMELLSVFFGKLLYAGALMAAPLALLFGPRGADIGAGFLHIFLFLTLIGALFNNTLFLSDANSYYAVFLMRMDARRYALANYFYYLLKTFLGFAGVLAPAWAIGRAAVPGLAISPLWIGALPALVVGVKLAEAAAELTLFHRTGKLLNEYIGFKGMIPLIVVLLLAAYGLPYLGWTLPVTALTVICVAAIAAAVPACMYLLRSREYRRIYQTHPYQIISESALQQSVQEGYQSKLVLEAGQGSRRSGCGYLNDLFVQRHRRLLVRSPRRMALILCAAAAVLMLACLVSKTVAGTVNDRLMHALPFSLLLMYFISRGEKITEIMFFNCDHSLLAYRFYRRPKVILELFRARLRTVIGLNLLPAAVIAVALPLLLLVSGGTEHPVEYVVMAVSIPVMSVFFSTHYLVLYYLLQPYTAGLESRNPAYRVLTSLTYLVCYFVGTRLGGLASPLLFGGIVIAFCLLYLPVALILVYRLAPKTFRLRQ